MSRPGVSVIIRTSAAAHKNRRLAPGILNATAKPGVKNFFAPRFSQKGVTPMYVTYQALEAMFAFGMLIVALISLLMTKKK